MRRVKLLGASAAIIVGMGLVGMELVGLGLAGVAHAAPLTPGALGLSVDSAPIQTVRDGCGPGGHANIYGECRSNYPTRPRYGYGYGEPGYERPYGAPPPRPFYKPYGTPNY